MHNFCIDRLYSFIIYPTMAVKTLESYAIGVKHFYSQRNKSFPPCYRKILNSYHMLRIYTNYKTQFLYSKRILQLSSISVQKMFRDNCH